MNIGTLFSRHARYRPNHLALVFEDKRLTHLELNREMNRLANALYRLVAVKIDMSLSTSRSGLYRSPGLVPGTSVHAVTGWPG